MAAMLRTLRAKFVIILNGLLKSASDAENMMMRQGSHGSGVADVQGVGRGRFASCRPLRL
jgi:hypothetical protein